MTLIACGSTRHLRRETSECSTCGAATVQLLAFADTAYWGVDRVCMSCGTEFGDADVVPESGTLEERLAQIVVKAESACECPMVFFEGELDGGFVYAPCVHELARSPMDFEALRWMLQEVGGIVKVGLGMDRERRGPEFDAFPDGTILDDGPYITMAALKTDGVWETQGHIGPLEVRSAFMWGRVKLRVATQ